MTKGELNMANRKKMFFLLVMLFSAALVLAACGGESSESSKSDDTLKVWSMSDGFKDFVKTYEEENDIKIDVQTIPWDSAHDKLLTAVASGKGPDVLQIGNTWVAEFAEAGTFLDLSEYIDEYSNFNPDNFYDSAIATTQFEDQVIGIPWYVDTRLLYYRTDILEEVGYPNGPETWEDLIDASEKIVANGGDDQFAVDLPNEGRYSFILGWVHGWDYDIDKGSANFDAPEFKKGVDIFNTFYENGYSQIGEGKELVQAFSDGTKPMFFSGPWDLKTIKDNAPELDGKWSVTLIPKVEQYASEMGGAHLAVFHNSDKVDQALDFINWMADPDTQVEWFKHFSELPANVNAWDNPVLADDPLIATFGEQLEVAKAVPLIPEYEKMTNDLADAMEEMYRGGASWDEVLAQFKEKVDKMLAE